MESIFERLTSLWNGVANLLKDPLLQGFLGLLGGIAIVVAWLKYFFGRKPKPDLFFTFSELKSNPNHQYSNFEFDWVHLRKYQENGKIIKMDPLAELEKLLKKDSVPFLIISGFGGYGKSRLIWEFAKKHRKKCAFFNWRAENIDQIKIHEDLKKLPKSIKYIILDDVHVNPSLAVSICIGIKTKDRTFILLTRYGKELRDSFAKEHLFNIPVIQLSPMHNVSELCQDTKLEPFIVQRSAQISEGNPEIFRLALRLAESQSTRKDRAELIKSFQGITNPERLFITIQDDIEKKTNNRQARALCARAGLLRGIEKSDPCCRDNFDFFMQLKKLGYGTFEGDTFYIMPDILGDFLAQHYYFPEGIRSPEFEKLIDETSVPQWKSIMASLAVFTKEASQAQEKLFHDAARFILSSAGEKSNSEEVADLAVTTYELFSDFELVHVVLGDFWKAKIKSNNMSLLNSLGIFYHRTGDFEHAFYYWDSLQTIARKEKNEQWLAIALGHLGLVYQDKGQWDKASQFYEKSLEIKEKVGDIQGMANTYVGLGNIHRAKGQWDQASQFYEKALKIFEKVGDIQGMAITYNNLGLLYQDKGQWDKASQFYEKSLEIKEKVGDIRGMAQTFNNLGLVYQAKGQWDQASQFYENAREIFEKVGDIQGMAQTYTNIGNIYQLKGQWDKASQFYEKSLEWKEKVGDIHGMAQTYGNLSMLFFKQKKYEQAVLWHYEVLFVFIKLGAMAEVAQTKGNLGNFRHQMGESEFQKVTETALNKILKQGVKWGGLAVVSAPEAEQIRALLNSSD